MAELQNFDSLRAANLARQADWVGAEDVGLMFRAVELAGETGEAMNVAKKLERERRGWRGSRATVEDLAAELADIVICADLMAIAAGIDLDAAVVAKFNATSQAHGFPQRLASSPEPRPRPAILDPIKAQSAEFKAAFDYADEVRRIGLTAVVEDDYPRVRRAYEAALSRFIESLRANGRI